MYNNILDSYRGASKEFKMLKVERFPLEGGAKKQTPTTIVVHAMSEYLIVNGKNVHAPEFLKSIGLSVHACVTPAGIIIRSRDDTQGAYHARKHNKNSLGIEFLVKGNHNYSSFSKAIKEDYVTPEQYEAGIALVKEWIELYKITDIVRHSDLDPERKIDPGVGFNWGKFISDVSTI